MTWWYLEGKCSSLVHGHTHTPLQTHLCDPRACACAGRRWPFEWVFSVLPLCQLGHMESLCHDPEAQRHLPHPTFSPLHLTPLVATPKHIHSHQHFTITLLPYTKVITSLLFWSNGLLDSFSLRSFSMQLKQCSASAALKRSKGRKRTFSEHCQESRGSFFFLVLLIRA